MSTEMSNTMIHEIDASRDKMLSLAGKKNASEVSTLFENLKKFVLDSMEAYEKEVNKKMKKMENQVAKASGKKPKRVRDPEMPKRPATSYMLYCNENREKVKKDNPEMKLKDIISHIGEMWKGLSDKKKKKYEDEATKLRASFNEAMEAYHAKHPVIEPPKGALSSYMLFCKDHYDEVKKRHSDVPQTEITKILSDKWKNSKDTVKAEYKIKAEDDRKRAVKEMEQFKTDHPEEYEAFMEKKQDKKDRRAEKRRQNEEEECDEEEEEEEECEEEEE